MVKLYIEKCNGKTAPELVENASTTEQEGRWSSSTEVMYVHGDVCSRLILVSAVLVDFSIPRVVAVD